jgi:hypothetical protein
MESSKCAPIGLLVCGGAALNALGLLTRNTRDVDAICAVENSDGVLSFVKQDRLPAELVELVDDVANDLGLPTANQQGASLPEDQKWLNLGPQRLLDLGLPDGIERRLTRKEYGSRLTIYFVDRLDQIPFKLHAMVVSQRQLTHLQDFEALKPTDDEIKMAATWLAGRSLSPAQKTQLREVLWELGHVRFADELGL